MVRIGGSLCSPLLSLLLKSFFQADFIETATNTNWHKSHPPISIQNSIQKSIPNSHTSSNCRSGRLSSSMMLSKSAWFISSSWTISIPRMNTKYNLLIFIDYHLSYHLHQTSITLGAVNLWKSAMSSSNSHHRIIRNINIQILSNSHPNSHQTPIKDFTPNHHPIPLKMRIPFLKAQWLVLFGG